MVRWFSILKLQILPYCAVGILLDNLFVLGGGGKRATGQVTGLIRY